jgi:hypothetical protein
MKRNGEKEMNKKIWIGIVSILGIALLGAAVYLAIILTGNRIGILSAGARYELILPTQYPDRQSDVEGFVVEVKDNSIFVRPAFKREGGQQDYPPVEVVVGSTTEIYRDETDRQHPIIVDGKFEWVINPFALDQIEVGYVLNAWGARRGDRVVADVIIIYVVPTDDAPQP